MKQKHIWRSLLLSSAMLFTVSVTEAHATETTNTQQTTDQIQLAEPTSVHVLPTGQVLVVDASTHKLYNITNGTTIGKYSGLDEYGLPLGGYLDSAGANAMFNTPYDAVVDSKGIIYISDANNNVIRKIVDGAVYTHAGTGEAGFKNGAKTSAQFNYPTGLAIDENDHLYVADTLNHIIRKVTPDGFVTTFAGQANETGSLQNGSAFTARFNEPVDVTFGDEGQLFVSDSGNQVIRVIENSNVSTYAGVATTIDAETGYYEGGYQNGLKEAARFYYPAGIDFEAGYLFIADTLNNRVRAVTPEGDVLNIAGQSEPGNATGALEEAQFDTPSDVKYANNQLFVVDTGNATIKSFPLDVTAIKGVETDAELLSSTPFTEASVTPQVWLNGQQLTFNGNVTPMNIGDKIYVPVHAFFEAWGADVRQLTYKKSITVTKGGKAFPLTIDEQSILLKDGRSYIDVAFLNTLKPFKTVTAPEYNAVVIQGR